MAQKKSATGSAVASKPAVTGNAKKPRSNAKLQGQRGPSVGKLRDLAKTHKPPQRWHDEDFSGIS